MSGVRWREGEAVLVKTEPGSNPVSSTSDRMRPLSHAVAFASPHAIELLAPLYPTVPCHDGEITVHAVTLRRTADDWLQIMFPELSRPGKMVAMDVACVNYDTGGCRCDFVRLLRSVMVLMEKQIFRVTTKYVITSVISPLAIGTEACAGNGTIRTATLQLFVGMHERVTRSKVESLLEFDLVLSHLQSGLMAITKESGGDRVMQTLESAKHSKCHVVGCELHPFEEEGAEPPKFTLDEVFHRLTTHVEVEQMPIRDDETYIARMKRARREIILTDLPVTALHTFIRMLGARDLAAVSSSCSMFQHMAYEVVPGLKLLLYSHQRKALKWLLYREGSSREALTSMIHPFVFPGVSLAHDGNPQDEATHPKVIDLIDGKLVKQATISPARDFRGGLFCDEPGLGKTITMLALVLRTKGQKSDPHRLYPPVSNPRRSSVTLRSSESRGRVLNPLKLTASATSLIVVPNPLIDHWKYQIEAHLSRGALKVYVDDLEFKSILPSPEELATYDVVITSFGRLSHEWKFGRPKSALEERMPDRYGFEDGPQRFIDGTLNRGTSPLLMVHWVRIIVDEGHKLGGTNPTNHMRMARLFHADKRWVMTGTPTPDTLRSADLRFLHGLLVFLRDCPYGDVDGKAWIKAIARPFEQNERAGYVRLLHMLNRIMMRHTKESIKSLIPTPIRHVVLLDPTPKEYAMYNGVTAVARANLVITNMDEKHPGKHHPDSLLNPINRKYAKIVVDNLREATCAGAQIIATLTEATLAETVNMLVSHNVDADRVAEVTQFMRKARTIDFLSLCSLCGRHLQLLMVVPCGHMACADCVESRIESVGASCGICNASYERQAFIELQPGFEFQRTEDEWAYDHGNQEATETGGGQANTAPGGTPQRRPQQRGRGRNDGSTIPVREREGNRQRIIPIDLARFAAVNASKAFYVASRIKELRKQFETLRTSEVRQDNGSWKTRANRPKVVKAIIFSQFKEHIWRVKVALAQQGIPCADFIIGISPAMRMQGLHRFRHDPNINVLVLTDVGSHGLDLSFVTHIFLMEEIWDKSLESQVVSRAHRMGAQQSVVVEQLLMRGSVEEIMHDSNRRLAASPEPEEEEETEEDHKPSHQRKNATAGQSTGSQAIKSLFSGSAHKGKRPAQRTGTMNTSTANTNNNDASGKSSMRQRQLQHVLQSLRLIEEDAVAEFGFVKFKVVDENGGTVRAASLHLPNPGLPPASALSIASSAKAASLAVNASTPPVSQTKAGNGANQKPSVSQKPSASVSSSIPARPLQNGKQKKSVRIKLETASPPAPSLPGKHQFSASGVIDLTSDGDSDCEEKQAATASRERYSDTSSDDDEDGGFETSSAEDEGEEDDSETDDEYTRTIKREVIKVESRSPHVAVKGNGKGKRKLRVEFNDNSTDEV